jgi:DNA-binding response OmpR family regulator
MAELQMRPLVLLADPETETRDLYGDWFTSQGFEVVGTAVGDWAFAIATECRPDVMVTELTLGRIDGLTVIRQLRASLTARQLPILVCTRCTDATLLAHARAADTHVVPKLAPFADLATHLRALLPRVVPGAMPFAPRPTVSTARLMRVADSVYAAERQRHSRPSA